eukprot:04751_4
MKQSASTKVWQKHVVLLHVRSVWKVSCCVPQQPQDIGMLPKDLVDFDFLLSTLVLLAVLYQNLLQGIPLATRKLLYEVNK